MSLVTFVYTWSFILRPVAQSELDSGTPAAGRNKHNGFFSVVAEFRTLLSYGKVDQICHVSTLGKVQEEVLPGINQPAPGR